ncbi:Calx-beta domain-containing protein, partial [Vibrio genomosp. F6]|uniref:Calx-beta domain-containing protein n=1 Tax=Vibrio genomosp. F6 TaxID=723172 RepID=UPI0005925365
EVQSISSPTVSEGSAATFDVELTNASQSETTVSMTLANGTAEGGTDYSKTTVTVTYADQSTETVPVDGDGKFSIQVPASDTTFSIVVDTLNDEVFEGDETFTLEGSTANQGTPTEGTA